MRLLIVENDVDLVASLVTTFAAFGLSADTAGTVADAHQMVLLTNYAAVILDLGLPDEYGLNLIRRLRAEQRHEPIIVLSAMPDPETRVTALRAGADDYLVKPFAFEELHARVEAVLRRDGRYHGDQIRCGELRFDVRSRQLNKGDEVIELSQRELDIIEILFRRVDRVTPRSLLEDHLSGNGNGFGSNALEVYVHRLRRKIDACQAGAAVRTIRGAGYMLMDQTKRDEALTPAGQDMAPKLTAI
jgi:DNA-binding response OmpR family regulator